MDITISLDGVLTDAQQKQIQDMFGSASADPLPDFCRAAIAESADAILARRQDSAANALLQRLYWLIKLTFKGNVPSEGIVSRIFGITDRRALSMIATVSKKYGDEFKSGWIAAVQAAFENAEAGKDEQGNYYRFNAPQAVVDYLKEVIGDLSAGRLAPIQRVKGMAGLYEIRQDTYDDVCEKLGIVIKKKSK